LVTIKIFRKNFRVEQEIYTFKGKDGFWMEANIEALSLLMVEKKLSQAQLAKKIGVSRSCISRIMSGKRTASSQVMAGFKKAFPEYSLDYYFTQPKIDGTINK